MHLIKLHSELRLSFENGDDHPLAYLKSFNKDYEFYSFYTGIKTV